MQTAKLTAIDKDFHLQCVAKLFGIYGLNFSNKTPG